MIKEEFEKILETRIENWNETKRRKSRMGMIDQRALTEMCFALAREVEKLQLTIKLLERDNSSDVQDSPRAKKKKSS